MKMIHKCFLILLYFGGDRISKDILVRHQFHYFDKLKKPDNIRVLEIYAVNIIRRLSLLPDVIKTLTQFTI